ncbi:MAG: HEAT repeat domain-containing protein [Sandaracinaceae bacterium]|nr:HEAT repeat domain-containing protein [Sandaracinaceae bacterium]
MSEPRSQYPAETVEDLVARLASSSAEERREAAVELAARVQPNKTAREQSRLLEALLGALADPVTRLAAVQGLRRMRAKSALEPLCHYLDDPSQHVRTAVYEALGTLGDPVVLPRLRARHADETERSWALGQVIEKLERAAASTARRASVVERSTEGPPDTQASMQSGTRFRKILPEVVESIGATLERSTQRFAGERYERLTATRDGARAIFDLMSTGGPDPDFDAVLVGGDPALAVDVAIALARRLGKKVTLMDVCSRLDPVGITGRNAEKARAAALALFAPIGLRSGASHLPSGEAALRAAHAVGGKRRAHRQ